ncbi:unnamed protein product [Vitrella brassicaformis CCMP3155]|uniref:Pseudouridine synthase RsuA/RluA-like domain-containing protein n=4 Tax=Vitrella brassicaformis TaxID=1169539 RepID=A0A0G4ERB0_VITBC|nr:unnamed protein product [Vitrella brassicaformis CCMP3155]|eukprot:CEM00798.1 unnamed protein product [Vitrella brassicaformis CCMP3155]
MDASVADNGKGEAAAGEGAVMNGVEEGNKDHQTAKGSPAADSTSPQTDKSASRPLPAQEQPQPTPKATDQDATMEDASAHPNNSSKDAPSESPFPSLSGAALDLQADKDKDADKGKEADKTDKSVASPSGASVRPSKTNSGLPNWGEGLEEASAVIGCAYDEHRWIRERFACAADMMFGSDEGGYWFANAMHSLCSWIQELPKWPAIRSFRLKHALVKLQQATSAPFLRSCIIFSPPVSISICGAQVLPHTLTLFQHLTAPTDQPSEGILVGRSFVDMLREFEQRGLKNGNALNLEYTDSNGGVLRPREVYSLKKSDVPEVKEEPGLMYENKHFFVLYKPPFYKCDTKRIYTGQAERSTAEILISREVEPFQVYVSLTWNHPLSKNVEEDYGLCHRLDKETSGPVLIAKYKGALEALKSQIRRHEVTKEYLCLVHGAMSPGTGHIEAPIRNFKIGQRKGQSLVLWGEDALPSYTMYTVLGHYRMKRSDRPSNTPTPTAGRNTPTPTPGPRRVLQMDREMAAAGGGGGGALEGHDDRYTLLKCQIITGRTHQIRVHMLYAGHPLVADPNYLSDEQLRRDRKWCRRNFLHEFHLGWRDPINARKFAVKCELPPDLKQALSYLEEDLSPPPPSHMSYIPPQPQPSPSPITQEESKPAAIDEQEDSVMVDGERKEEDQNQSPVDKDGKQDGGQGEGDGARVEDVEMAPASAAADDNGADSKDEAAEEPKKSDEKSAEGERDRPALPTPAAAAAPVVPPEWSSYPFYDICRSHGPLTEMQALAASVDAEIEVELKKERERLDEERQRRDKERSVKMERERVKREKDAADKDKKDKTPVPPKRGDSPSKMTSASRRKKKLGDLAARGGRSEGSPEGERGGEEDADGRGRKRQRSAPRSAKDSEEITPSNRRKANGIKDMDVSPTHKEIYQRLLSSDGGSPGSSSRANPNPLPIPSRRPQRDVEPITPPGTPPDKDKKEPADNKDQNNDAKRRRTDGDGVGEKGDKKGDEAKDNKMKEEKEKQGASPKGSTPVAGGQGSPRSANVMPLPMVKTERLPDGPLEPAPPQSPHANPFKVPSVPPPHPPPPHAPTTPQRRTSGIVLKPNPHTQRQMAMQQHHHQQQQQQQRGRGGHITLSPNPHVLMRGAVHPQNGPGLPMGPHGHGRGAGSPMGRGGRGRGHYSPASGPYGMRQHPGC